MLRRLLPSGAEPVWQDPSGSVQLAEVAFTPAWIGHRLSELEESAGVRVAFVTRVGEGVLPTPQMVVQEGDLVHVMLRRNELTAVEAAFAKGPEEAGH
ncbi:MAG: TrkA C-terminal domain-containing protein, partial [Kitasatospora sp.]|jgi:trk system potassium uptake protein TrkA|nr:TrkA C-terminal domain-containing protein [Kitasatospora sp.]